MHFIIINHYHFQYSWLLILYLVGSKLEFGVKLFHKFGHTKFNSISLIRYSTTSIANEHFILLLFFLQKLVQQPIVICFRLIDMHCTSFFFLVNHKLTILPTFEKL